MSAIGSVLLLLASVGMDDGVQGRDEAQADRLTVRIPLTNEGELELGRLIAAVAEAAALPDLPAEIDLSAAPNLPVEGLAGALTRRVLLETLGSGSQLRVTDGVLELELSGTSKEIAERLQRLARRGQGAAVNLGDGRMWARPSYRPNNPSRPTILLIHGVNSSQGSFVHLAPALEREGYGIVLYDYPFSRDLDKTAPAFETAWKSFREEADEQEPWAILCHSMGALLARFYVEGENHQGDVAALILIGPPNRGSELARAQALLEWIEGLQAATGRDERAIGRLSQGIGEAAEDLSPGSDFLKRLEEPGPRPDVPYYILAGSGGFLSSEARDRIEAQYQAARDRTGLLGRIVGLATGDIEAVLDELTEGTGDGAVAVSSTKLPGVAEHKVIPADHVELIRGPLFYPEPGPIACLPDVLRWLEEAGFAPEPAPGSKR